MHKVFNGSQYLSFKPFSIIITFCTDYNRTATTSTVVFNNWESKDIEKTDLFHSIYCSSSKVYACMNLFRH